MISLCPTNLKNWGIRIRLSQTGIKTFMTFKQLFAKSFHISRRFRMIFYIRFNRLKFWLNDVKFGQNMQVYNNLYLMKCRGSRIIVGDNFMYTSGESFNPLCRNIKGCMYTVYPHSIITIGNDTGMSSACLWANTSITIGNYVKIGGDCIIMDTDAHKFGLYGSSLT